MEFTKKYKAYVLIDPITKIPRYVGITQRTLRERFAEHMSDIYNRPTLNPHKTNWFKKLLKEGLIPQINQIAEFNTVEEMKQFEINYIAKYKEEYKLINLTAGGDYMSDQVHTRESILKSKRTRAVTQYNILGEKIAEYEIMEDIARTLNLREKACSHVTQCCKGTRKHAYGYIWRYKDEELGDISEINPKSLFFNKLVQYDLNGNRIAEYDSYTDASKAIGDNSKGGNIASVANGKQKSCKGFYFQVEPLYCYFDQKLFNTIYSKIWSPKSNKIRKRGKTVMQLDLNKNVIAVYNSYLAAAEQLVGVEKSAAARRHISDCCKNPNKTYKNYYWQLADDRASINPSNSENESYLINSELKIM